MCYNCGCDIPYFDMGDPDNITTDTLSQIAQEWGVSLAEVKIFFLVFLSADFTPNSLDEDKINYLEEIFKKAALAWGQTIEEAKMETLKLLKKELQK